MRLWSVQGVAGDFVGYSSFEGTQLSILKKWYIYALKKTQYAEMVKIYRSGIVKKYKLYHVKMVSFGLCVKYMVIHNVFEFYTLNYVFNMY